jgi:hypothetical protein
VTAAWGVWATLPPGLCLSPWGNPWARDQSDGRGSLPVGGAGAAWAAPVPGNLCGPKATRGSRSAAGPCREAFPSGGDPLGGCARQGGDAARKEVKWHGNSRVGGRIGSDPGRTRGAGGSCPTLVRGAGPTPAYPSNPRQHFIWLNGSEPRKEGHICP